MTWWQTLLAAAVFGGPLGLAFRSLLAQNREYRAANADSREAIRLEREGRQLAEQRADVWQQRYVALLNGTPTRRRSPGSRS